MPGTWGVAQDICMIFPLSQEASWPLLPFSLVCDGIKCLKSVKVHLKFPSAFRIRVHGGRQVKPAKPSSGER